MNERKPPARTVKTANTVFAIIENLSELGGSSVTELAHEAELAKSTVSDHLATLEDMGYVVREGGEFHVGLQFLKHGNRARKRLEVRQAAIGPLQTLADRTSESAWLVVEEHDEAVFIDKALGDQAVQTMGEIGRRAHLHTTAAGKAILAHLPDHQRESVIEEHGLPARTENTITDPAELGEELQAIRGDQLAFNDEESNRGVFAVASPILFDETVCGAISVSGPKSRLSVAEVKETITEEVLNAANILELNLEHDHN